jgi:outer membrane receptor for ferrienterochelin and colicins
LAAPELTGGIDLRWTDPRTGGTIHGRFEDSDLVRELGAFLTGTVTLDPRVSLVAATRLDHHNRLGSALSPRAGIVLRPSLEHALRLTYNRAHVTPSPATLFADFVVQQQGSYAVRVTGIPREGFTFRRDCGGLCMRTPLGGDPSAFIPADGTLLWSEIVRLVSRDADISDIPAPSAAQVPSYFLLGGTTPVNSAGLADVAPNRREITDAVEAGYRGLLGGRILLEADLHHTRVRDVIATLAPITPNVFLDPAALAQYLSSWRPSAEAAQLAELIAHIQLGTVSPAQAVGADILVSSRQGGSYALWGADFAVTALLRDDFTARLTWSWADRDSIRGLHGGISLGVPRSKGTIGLRWGGGHGRTVEARVRALRSHPVASGSYAGRVEGRAEVDISAGTRLGGPRGPELLIAALNAVGRRQQHFPMGPAIGRTITVRMRTSL